MKISVILAAHNEADNILQVISRIKSTLPGECDILLIDDGSADNTADIAKSTGIRVLENPSRMGKGYSLRRGIENSDGEIAVFIDCDLQDLPEEIPLLIEPIRSGYDMAIGSKFIGACRTGAISKINVFGNMTMTVLINLLYGCRFTDSQSGFKAFRMARLKEICLVSDEYEIETELLIKALKKKLKIIEIPVTGDKRNGGTSGFRRIKNGTRVLLVILKERFMK